MTPNALRLKAELYLRLAGETRDQAFAATLRLQAAQLLADADKLAGLDPSAAPTTNENPSAPGIDLPGPIPEEPKD